MTMKNGTMSAVLALAATWTPADTLTWKASPFNTNWDTLSVNWSDGSGTDATWTDGDSAVFPNLSSAPTLTIAGARRAADVTFNGKCTLSGTGSLQVDGKLTDNAGATINVGFGGTSVRLGGAENKLLTMKGAGNSSQSVTYLEDKAIFYVNDDLRFGPVPQTQTDSIVVSSGNPGLYTSSLSEIASTRTIRIAPNAGLRMGNNVTGTQSTTFRGLVCGTPDSTLGYVTNTTVSIWNQWNNWNVDVRFNPGAGRTNDLGRLEVASRLAILGGATQVAAPLDNKTGANAPLYVHGRDSKYQAGYGNLTIDGGALVCPQSAKYVHVGDYGQVTVTNGGCIHMPGVEWLQALNTPARLTVCDGGEFTVGTLRLAFQTSGSEIRLGEGGIIAANVLGLCPSETKPGCDFVFDGGAVRSRAGRSDFMRSTTGTTLTEADWAGVHFLVGAKGAVFDSTNGQNIFWSRPLESGTDADVADGGVTVVGDPSSASLKGLVLTSTNTFTGGMVVRDSLVQARVDDAIPRNAAIRLENSNIYAYTFANSGARHTTNSISRLEGCGIVYYTHGLTIDGAVAPDAGRDLDIKGVCRRLAGDLEVRAGDNGCGRLLVAPGQDVSDLRITLANASELDKNARHEVLAASSGSFSGSFDESALPEGWRVRYTAASATLSYLQPTTLILR